MEEKVIEFISEKSGIPNQDITKDSKLEHLELDSLDVIEIVMEIEREFKIRIPDIEIENIKIVGDLFNIIKKYTDGL
jgi:acyl carrier protein